MPARKSRQLSARRSKRTDWLAGSKYVDDRVFLEALFAPVFDLQPDVSIDLDDLPLGASRLGGPIDLPTRTKWPRIGRRPLAPLAQFDLAALPSTTPQLLPRSGFLYLFGDLLKEFPTTDLVRALYVDVEADELERVESPEAIDELGLECAALEFRSGRMLPHEADLLAPRVAHDLLDEDEVGDDCISSDDWTALRGAGSTAGGGLQLLGHPELVQNDVPLSAELFRAGLSRGAVERLPGKKSRALVESAAQQLLLVQFPSDDEGDHANWSFPQGGTLYVTLHAEDLARRRFDRVYSEVQFD